MPSRSMMLRGAAALAVCSLYGSADAALTFGLYGNWDSQARYDAANRAMTNIVNRYNVYGDFTAGNNGNIPVFYNPGVPTAQSGYGGYGSSIEFGGTYPNDRVAQHESNHWMGSGTWYNWGPQFNNGVWTGARVNQLMQQFDGESAVLRQAGVHFYNYGLNYDNEVYNDATLMRNVALTYAMRQDMGNGVQANPWSAKTVTLTASDPLGTSAFNWFGGGYSGNYQGWSDRYFAHAGAAYSTGDYIIRTPTDSYNVNATTPSFTFAGDSLTVNNTNGINGGMLFKGVGTSGVVTIKNLILDGGYVRHATNTGDLFRLAGNVTLKGNPTIDAGNGNIEISAAISGSGSLNKAGANVLTLTAANGYAGATNIKAGTLRLASRGAVANYSFDNVSGATVLNGGFGGAGMNGTLANGATVVAGGRFGNAVSLANGASVDINSPITDLGSAGNWAVSAWVKTTADGSSILTKGNGTGWNGGNTIFYLGDGDRGGSGGLPSGVRNGGGFFQPAPAGSTPVTDGQWHLVTYVNKGGTYAIYTDGVLQSLNPGNDGFVTADVGSVVRLGVSTNTVAADGTRNFNGLMDAVQFYGQSLSPEQVAALFQGRTLGTLPSTTVVNISNGAALDLNGTAQEVSGLTGVAGSKVLLNGGELIVNNAGDATYAGQIVGSGSFTKSGPGTLTLTGANGQNGQNTINGGTLVISGQYALGGSAYGGTTFNGGTLKYAANLSGANGGSDISRDDFARPRPVTINAGGATIDTNGNDVTFASSIGNYGAGGLTKLGAGRLTLDAAATYAGPTVVGGGALRVNGSLAASSGLTVNAGGTLEGTGTVFAITLDAGGKIEPGTGIGTLHGGSLTWNSDGVSSLGLFELGSADGSSDLLALSGALVKGGGSQFLFDFSGGVDGQTYTLISFADGQTSFSASDFAVAPTTGNIFGTFSVDGDSVNFTRGVAVPEPTGVLVLGAAGLGALCRRRRTS